MSINKYYLQKQVDTITTVTMCLCAVYKNNTI